MSVNIDIHLIELVLGRLRIAVTATASPHSRSSGLSFHVGGPDRRHGAPGGEAVLTHAPPGNRPPSPAALGGHAWVLCP